MYTVSTKFKTSQPPQLLGNTIGIYGDSFAVRPRVIADNGEIRMRRGADWDADDICRLRHTYLQENYATPQHNPHGIAWWTYQISQRFNTAIHYGVSGTSPEHMIYSQIDVENNFEKMFPGHQLAKNIVPDVMIMCWSQPIRAYFDPYYWFHQTKTLTSDDVYWLNTGGTAILFDQRWIAHTKRRQYITMIKHRTTMMSPDIMYHTALGLKIMFDQRWYPQLKKINPKLKVIHFDCFDLPPDICSMDHQFENSIWVKNFSLRQLEHAHGDAISWNPESSYLEWTKNICHMQHQHQHDFLTKTIIDLIHNYQYLDTNFDFSDWKDQYKMLQ